MTDLWSLTIAFRGGNSSMRLIYNDADKVSMAYERLKRPAQSAEEFDRGLPEKAYDKDIEIADSYGSTATIDRDTIMVHWITCLGDQAEGLKAENILNAHAQASLQRKLAADPLLKDMLPQQPAGQRFNLNG